ncbi:outer membrane lipid asymmetry maintenance protein MlaD [Candidatus Mesenet endosymbiont of Phosphuga atrata]|uniref:outer membrane lipid asymmetry maintenance protein MlaD n=1 Tax=Candidatus Mesenet endosymbiont of Phosphuga atrata TaxID=3066221 RepID=UPI0030D0AC31
MTKSNITEAIIGLFVLVFVAVIAFFIFDNLKTNHDDCYQVNAMFSDVTGLDVGSSVKISGVKAGVVTNISLKKEGYVVEVSMCINENILLPVDSIARVTNSNLLENKFINIYPGAEDDVVTSGGIIENTQSDMGISKLVDKAISSLMKK